MKIADVLEALDRFAPFSNIMEPDNCGLLVGGGEADAGSVLVCLDITKDAVEAAKRLGCGLIVSHHPVIWHPLSALRPDSVPYLLAAAGIGAVCAHTNLDCAPGGVNDTLAQKLGLENIESFALGDGSDQYGLGRIGTLSKTMSAAEFADHAAGLFGPVRFFGVGGVRRAAVCGGAGGEWLPAAAALGADAFVTGEIKHHQWLEAARLGVTAVEAGHFATEEHIRGVLADYLKQQFPGARIFVSDEKSPYVTVAKNGGAGR